MAKALSKFSIIASLLFGFLLTSGCAYSGELSNLRGQRYGEILLGKGGLVLPKEFDVYNTIGLNDCPQDAWSKLDPETIKKENHVKIAKLNGPRYWLIDGMVNSSLVSKEIRDFGGIKMRHAGTIELTLQDELSLGQPYVIHKVARNTTWVFKAGKPVYQLIDPSGHVYFMQSYSVQKQAQNPNTLADLGSKLKLKHGWTFRALDLKNDFEVKAENGMAYVVQDNFDNTYQRSSAKAADSL